MRMNGTKRIAAPFDRQTPRSHAGVLRKRQHDGCRSLRCLCQSDRTLAEHLRHMRFALLRMLFDRGLKLLEKSHLLGAKTNRYLHIHPAQEIPTPPTFQGRQSESLESQYRSALSLGGDIEILRALKRKDASAATERQGHETDRDLTVEIGALSPQTRVGAQMDLHIKISRCSSVIPCLSLSGQPDAIAFIDPGRDLDLKPSPRPDTACATAFATICTLECSATLAAGTGLAQCEKSLLDTHFSLTVAIGTALGLSAGCGSTAMTGLASHEGIKLDWNGSTRHDLFQIEFQPVDQIPTARRCTLAEGTSKNAPEEVSENLVGIKSTSTEPGGTSQTRMTKTVVDPAPLWIRQDIKRLLGFLETLLGLWITRVPVRMIFHRKATEGFFELIRARVPGY